MKLKTTLEDSKALLGIIQIFKSIQRECVIRLQSNRTRFLSNTGGDGVQVWVGCRTDVIFKDFRCESHYKENSITCEILDMQQLFHIVKQIDVQERKNGKKVYHTLLRLSKRNEKPIIKLTMQSLFDQPDLSYDVPVRILTDQEIESITAPPLDNKHVKLLVPNLAELAGFVEKIKNTTCESITFECTEPTETFGGLKRGRDSDNRQRCNFSVHAENFLASFSLTYDGVEQIIDDKTDSEEDDDEQVEYQTASVTVDVKKLARFFSAIKDMTPNRVSLYLLSDALVLSVSAYNESTSMVSYVPAKLQ
ncbi:HUS1 checkpoint protein [Angomonas deanei]|uniref:Checkpoint protein n=1 Tax=Angomonas deanei TaxID=59799 RepID=A0A7G2CJA5_9TRYP|nr:HUS1 checkpoint protein [Angomonas deanei]CAD2219137.1 Hus1-like protein, putative [Angomonas deanei]|eukprot:EPY41989.1 HUS1 checkpoint protein [Angomonas deanei]